MKFIPSNQFINETTKFGRYFKRGKVYILKNIAKQDDKIKYVFNCDGEDKDIVFNNVKEADEFLSNF